MERPALAAFDIKPLQFSLEEAKKEKKKKKRKVVHHSENVAKVSQAAPFFPSTEAISGFREKGDKCRSRNVGRLKRWYLVFCNTP